MRTGPRAHSPTAASDRPPVRARISAGNAGPAARCPPAARRASGSRRRTTLRRCIRSSRNSPWRTALLEVLVRGGDDAHVRLHRCVPADAVVLAVGEHAQQAHLQIGRHVADLVEEQRAALGLLEATAARGLRAGERAALVTEQLGLEQVLRNRRRVDRDERPRRAGAVPVQRTGDQLLARTRFAGDQHGDVRLREPPDGAKHFLHRRRLPEHLRHFGGGSGGAGRARRRLRGRASDERERMVDVEGLGQVLERAPLECRDGALQIRVRGHHDHGNLRVLLLDRAEQGESRLSGHPYVGDEHLRLAHRQRLQHLVSRRERPVRDAFARQRLFQHPADRPVVVDDPDRLHRGALPGFIVESSHASSVPIRYRPGRLPAGAGW